MSRKNKYIKKKKKKKILKFLKEYSSVIMIGITLFAFIPNLFIWYYQKVNSSNFYVSYLSVLIDSDDWIKTYTNKNGKNLVYSNINCPTLNNSINKLMYKNSSSVKGYYVTYLIIKQTGDVTADNVKIKFKKYSSNKKYNETDLTNFKINNKKHNNMYKRIKYPFPKDETLKIPISICKTDDPYSLNNYNCYYDKYNPISIEYKNSYMIKNKKIKIRNYEEHNVIIDGEMMTGKGSA